MSDPTGVSIGKAAALYDLAPSTLRWWEARRALPEPKRVGGRRSYDETDLRRVGLVYLCTVAGSMTLEQAAVMTNGPRNDHWQDTVRQHAGALEEKIEKLRSAHGYLTHLLECPDDDLVDECPWLDGELMKHTPRGRVAVDGAVAAAEAVARRPRVRRRDATASLGDEMAIPAGHCAVCASPLTQPELGRRRRYCSPACRQRRYRRHRAATSSPDAGHPD